MQFFIHSTAIFVCIWPQSLRVCPSPLALSQLENSGVLSNLIQYRRRGRGELHAGPWEDRKRLVFCTFTLIFSTYKLSNSTSFCDETLKSVLDAELLLKINKTRVKSGKLSLILTVASIPQTTHSLFMYHLMLTTTKMESAFLI